MGVYYFNMYREMKVKKAVSGGGHTNTFTGVDECYRMKCRSGLRGGYITPENPILACSRFRRRLSPARVSAGMKRKRFVREAGCDPDNGWRAAVGCFACASGKYTSNTSAMEYIYILYGMSQAKLA